MTTQTKTEKVLGIVYKVGTKAHAKAVQQKKQFDDLNKYETKSC